MHPHFECGILHWTLDYGYFNCIPGNGIRSPPLNTGSIEWCFEFYRKLSDESTEHCVVVKGKTGRKCEDFQTQIWFDVIAPYRRMNVGYASKQITISDIHHHYYLVLNPLGNYKDGVKLEITVEFLDNSLVDISDVPTNLGTFSPGNVGVSSGDIVGNTKKKNAGELVYYDYKREPSPQKNISEHGVLIWQFYDRKWVIGESIRGPLLNTGTIKWYFDFCRRPSADHSYSYVMVRGKTERKDEDFRVQLQIVNAENVREELGFVDREAAGDDLSFTCYLKWCTFTHLWISVRCHEI